MSLTITPFNSGIHKGVRVYFFAAMGAPDNKPNVVIDLRLAYAKGWLKKVGSAKVFNQYATIRLRDTTTDLDIYASGSAQTCVPFNTLSQQFEVTRYDALTSASSFELVFYEDVQPAYSITAVLP